MKEIISENIEITKENFFISSTANFKEADDFDASLPANYISYARKVIWGVDLNNVSFNLEGIPEKVCVKDTTYDIIKYFTSKKNELGFLVETTEISSQYWFANGGVYRESDHWGVCRDCYWTLDGEEINKKEIAFCLWTDFTKIEI